MKNKKDSFSDILKQGPFFLLIKPDSNIYSKNSKKNLFYEEVDNLINAGLKNIEISCSNNEKWLEFISKIKFKYPQINLGSASVINKKSIDQSIKIGLQYSMMKFWSKELFNYAKRENHLLIPGIKNLKDLKEAINCHCRIIKIYPIKDKDNLIDIKNYKHIDFIAAGGLSISDIKYYVSLGYKAIVIGEKGYKNQKFDPKIYDWLKKNQNQE
tara:strand:- start:2 stop:640 length:639 start_codon:yes stop_codon:yes gene_type:complete